MTAATRSGAVWPWVLLLAALGGGVQAGDPAVDQAFARYYQALAGFGGRDLERELSAVIDAALLSGSHAGRPSTGQKRRQIADHTLAGARSAACTGGVPVSDACIRAVGDAADRAGMRFDPESIGTAGAVCARLLELDPPPGDCP